MEASIETFFLGRFGCASSESLSSDDSSLDSADLGGEISLFLGKVTSSLSSDSSLEATATDSPTLKDLIVRSMTPHWILLPIYE